MGTLEQLGQTQRITGSGLDEKPQIAGQVPQLTDL